MKKVLYLTLLFGSYFATAQEVEKNEPNQNEVATTTTENVVTVNTDAVNIREKPSTSSDILGSVGKGRKLEVISKSGDWTQVQFNKVKGYILSKFVS